MLKYKGREIPRYLDDCKKIVSVAEKYEAFITIFEAEEIWQDVSNNYCAGWLGISAYTNAEIWEMIENYFIEI